MNTLSNDTKDILMRTWQRDRLLQVSNALTQARVGAGNLWASPGDITPRKELLHLRIGIPDSDALPRAELNQAMQEIMDDEDDTSLRYGFGRGYSPHPRISCQEIHPRAEPGGR